MIAGVLSQLQVPLPLIVVLAYLAITVLASNPRKLRAMRMQRMGKSLHGATQHMGAWVISSTQAAIRLILLHMSQQWSRAWQYAYATKKLAI